MSTCTIVREALPALAAGEPDEVGAREHLGACAVCRAEHEGLKADLGRIRAGLATLDARPLRGGGVVRQDRSQVGRVAGPRVLSWWTAGLGIAALVVAGFLVGQALHERQGPSTTGPAAPGDAPRSPFTDVASIVARGDAPRVIQVRVEADGTTRMRWRALAGEAPWIERGPMQLAEGEFSTPGWWAQHAFAEALSEACPTTGTAATALSRNAPRLVVDVDARAPWRLVQLVLGIASGAPRHLARVTYLGGGAAPLDQDLPADLGPTEPPPEEFTSLRLVRKETTEKTKQVWTRLRLGESTTWDLPNAPTGPERDDVTALRVAAEARVFEQLADAMQAALKQAAPSAPVAVLIKTPPPTGGQVPAGDVLRAAATLRSAGVDAVWFEGAATALSPGPR